MNTISDILQGMRLTGGIFLEADFTEPWAVRSHVTPEDCRAFMHMPRQIIAYHLLTAGRCVIVLDSGVATQVKAGDLVILPRNTPHALASAATIQPVAADDIISLNGDGQLARIVYGGGGAATQLLCGFLGSANENSPLTAMLPDILRIDTANWAAATWIESAFRYAIQNLSSKQSDCRIVLGKLAELLFYEAVREYFAGHPQSRVSAVAGMQDAMVGRALMLMHQRMNEHWTTELLAREIGLSRSSFADRFTRALGEPPMRYLAHRRLEQASLRLRESSTAVTRIAYESGYESESAFNRAFRRLYGAPPAAWRRNEAEGPAADTPMLDADESS